MADPLQELQAALQHLQTVLSPESPTNCVESVARVSGCSHALLQHVAALQQALDNK
jgi:hypothetical protein